MNLVLLSLPGQGVDAKEGDGPQGQVAEYHHSEPQGAEHSPACVPDPPHVSCPGPMGIMIASDKPQLWGLE